MIRVVIIGAGNVAIHLAKALNSSPDIELVQYYSRDDKNKNYFPAGLKRENDLEHLDQADVYLVAVKDDAIGELGQKLKHLKGLIAHTSGSIPMDALSDCPRRGVVYPVQTFSKDREMKWHDTPLILETNLPDDMLLLRRLAAAMSGKIYEIDSKGRKKLHLAAVFANNFSNHMFSLSKQVCQENNLSFELMKPLILETAQKIMTIEPEEAQTGPARRNDLKVLKEQETQLSDEKKEIYSAISKSILEAYNTVKSK